MRAMRRRSDSCIGRSSSIRNTLKPTFSPHRAISGAGRWPATWTPSRKSEARRLGREAIRFGRDDGFSLAWGGFTFVIFARTIAEVREGAAFIDQGLLVNPNLARSWN